jgi:hypothetical protein
MQSTVSASLPAEKEVDGFIVHKLKLSEYAAVFEKLQRAPEIVAGLDLESPAALLAAIPRLVAVALPEIMDILAIACRLPREEIDQRMEPKTAIKCLRAVLEINDFLGLWEEISQVLPKPAGKAAKA